MWKGWANQNPWSALQSSVAFASMQLPPHWLRCARDREGRTIFLNIEPRFRVASGGLCLGAACPEYEVSASARS